MLERMKTVLPSFSSHNTSHQLLQVLLPILLWALKSNLYYIIPHTTWTLKCRQYPTRTTFDHLPWPNVNIELLPALNVNISSLSLLPVPSLYLQIMLLSITTKVVPLLVVSLDLGTFASYYRAGFANICFSGQPETTPSSGVVLRFPKFSLFAF